MDRELTDKELERVVAGKSSNRTARKSKKATRKATKQTAPKASGGCANGQCSG